MKCAPHLERQADAASRLLALAAFTLLAGCSTARPWVNEPAGPGVLEAVVQAAPPTQRGSVVAAMTFSGGGARAAAFGLGVLRELKATPLEWDGRKGTLLDTVGLVSGVSGGSILASYYAAFGDDVFTRFEPDYLRVDFQDRLLTQAVMPNTLWRLTSPWYGRGHVLADHLDELYRGKTFGDAAARPGAPLLVVTATDLSTGAPFEFNSEQMALLCSDLSQTPLSFAVAASASVPLLLAPLTLRNHADRCRSTEESALISPSSMAKNADNFRARMFRLSAESYRDAQARPFIHLVDGGVSDNLGVRPLLDRVIVDGSLDHAFRGAKAGSIRRVVLFVVNAERGLGERIDKSDRVPGVMQVINTLVFGAGSRETQVTLALLRDDLQRWSQELTTLRGQTGSPFASDAQIHVVGVSLGDTGDASLEHIPTSFSVTPEDMRRLQEAGSVALRRSQPFQHLLRELQEPSDDSKNEK
ncbi:NTE family protein [Paracidovorax konjaci]|uniref:NTE family protein n=2 Tax=Paracidovorax konjaci TaxID=32040 RepID=A0A1I1TXX8_9BURK|nr:NTE family protein [Paracidovorax konjaci]